MQMIIVRMFGSTYKAQCSLLSLALLFPPPPMSTSLISNPKHLQKYMREPGSDTTDLDFTPGMKSVKDVLAFAKKHQATMVDLTFVDVPVTLQHTSKPLHELNEDAAKQGYGFDGSSIRGFQQIEESDMLL